MFNKSLTTNIVSLIIIAVSYLSPKYNEIIYLTGLFALSGGITNWLAIHMLFEKIPFFYGSRARHFPIQYCRFCFQM